MEPTKSNSATKFDTDVKVEKELLEKQASHGNDNQQYAAITSMIPGRRMSRPSAILIFAHPIKPYSNFVLFNLKNLMAPVSGVQFTYSKCASPFFKTLTSCQVLNFLFGPNLF